MDRRKQMEADVFFNLATPAWQGYPLQGRAHFRSLAVASVNTDHTDDAHQPDASSLAPGQSPMAMLDGQDRLYQGFCTFGYPCQLGAKTGSIDDATVIDRTTPQWRTPTWNVVAKP